MLCAFAALTACGGADEPGAADPRRVVLVTYDSFVLPEAAAAAFTERTGAEIEVLSAGDSGTVLTRALLSAGAPEGDVIFGIDDASVTRALSEDLLEPFTPGAIDRVPERYRLDGAAGERLVPVDRGDVCMNVDTAWFAREGLEPPTTMDDLADPAYRDLLVVSSPVTSSPGLAFLLGTIDRYGPDGWEDYWSSLRDNGVRVRPSWDDAYYTDYTVSGGDRPVVLSYASSPPAEVVFSEGELDEPSSGVVVDTCAAQVEYAGVLRGAAEPELARELVEFLLSEEWQRELPLTNFVLPLVDVELPEEFRRWVPTIEDPAALPPEQIDANRDRWIERWRDLME
jgi:thiamine transport system substrate-binding protein